MVHNPGGLAIKLDLTIRIVWKFEQQDVIHREIDRRTKRESMQGFDLFSHNFYFLNQQKQTSTCVITHYFPQVAPRVH